MDMIRLKLNSERGASITFALLLFLVCAVLSSVIIVAATTASGRMAKTAVMDQRYYAVTSAAELLKNLIADQDNPVTIVKVVKKHVTETYSGGTVSKSETADSPKYYIVEKPAESITPADFIPANEVGGGFVASTIIKDAAAYLASFPSDNLTKTLHLTSAEGLRSDVGLDYDALAVTAEEELEPDGALKLTVYNTFKEKNVASASGSRYTLVLTFGADVSENKSVKSVVMDSEGYTVKTDTTETTTKTVAWHLISIKTGPQEEENEDD